MARRGGIRRVVRWAGLAAAVLLAWVWGASVLWYTRYEANSGSYIIDLGAGTATGCFGLSSGPEVPYLPGWSFQRYRYDGYPILGWNFQFRCNPAGTYVVLPLWMPWLLIAGLTAWRFRADRLWSPHACAKCGYDRKGLAAAVQCPECGTVPSRG
jgi:hypothetical protein